MANGMKSSRESALIGLWRWLSWTAVSALALAGMMLAAVSLPARLKLIGLFSLALGLTAGWVVGKIAHWRRIHHPRRLFPAATLLIAAALAGMTAESFRQWQISRDAELQAELRKSVGMRLLGPDLIDDFVQDQGTFEDYLAHRYSALVDLSRLSFPSSTRHFWWLLGIEIVAGSLAGGVISSRMVVGKFCESCGSWHEPKQSQVVEPITGNRCLELLSADQSVSLPNDAHLLLEFSTCRRGPEIPSVRCVLDRPGEAARVIVESQPDRATYDQLGLLLDEPIGTR